MWHACRPQPGVSHRQHLLGPVCVLIHRCGGVHSCPLLAMTHRPCNHACYHLCTPVADTLAQPDLAHCILDVLHWVSQQVGRTDFPDVVRTRAGGSLSCHAMLQKPWKEHETSLTEKQPFQVNGLRCISGNNLSDTSYTALVRCFPFSHTGVCMPTEGITCTESASSLQLCHDILS